MASSIAYFSSAVAFSPMPKSCSVLKRKHPSVPFHHQPPSLSTHSPTTPPRFSLQNGRKIRTQFSPMAASSSSIGNAEYSEEPATSVKFPNSISLSDCSSSLSLLGTGYREKVFAIIGVKVYAAGLYVNPSMLKDLRPWKGKSSNEVENDSVLFRSIYDSALEKSLQIILVRDVDGKTFWDALDEAVSPRVKAPTPVDDSALSTFRNIFQGRSLKKGTLILLTWLEPSKMLVSVSSNGLPTKSDATIESLSVTRALFDVFFGESPVSPTLGSVAGGLASAL